MRRSLACDWITVVRRGVGFAPMAGYTQVVRIRTYAILAGAGDRAGLAHSDNNFAEGAALTNVSEGRGYVVEPECAVDVDADIARNAQVG